MFLVLGATGNIGSLLVEFLVHNKQKVRAGVHSVAKADKLKALKVEVVEFDYAKPDLVEKAFKGVSAVFIVQPADWLSTTKIAVDAAKKAKVKFIVRLSALGADPTPGQLTAEHGQADEYVKACGIDYCIIRPNFFMANLLHHAGSIKAKGEYYGAAGDGKVAYVDPRDIAEAAGVAMMKPKKHKGKIYVLSGPEALTSADVAAQVTAYGVPCKYVDLEPEALKGGMLSQGMPEMVVGFIVQLEAVKKSGSGATLGDTEAALGHPGRSFKDYLKDFGAALKA